MNSDVLLKVWNPKDIVTCSPIQYQIAWEYHTNPKSPLREKQQQAFDAIKECEESHLEGDCDICRAEGT